MVCLGEIECNDKDLCDLTDHRPELAGSPEKFFRVLDKIEGPIRQEWAVQDGVINLFGTGRHDLVAPLVDALAKRTFKSDHLGEEAIQWAFYNGAGIGNQDIVELYCEHPAITSAEYAYGLFESWNDGKPNQVFQFLLGQADQGDLNMAKEEYAESDEQFRLAIDKAPELPHPQDQGSSSIQKGPF